MFDFKFLKSIRLSNVFMLLVIVFICCTLLIVINIFTIKVLSANRAYVNGESHYSKGQKDAVRHLITYLYTEDKEQWRLYQEELKVPKGDGAARVNLLNNSDINSIKNGFRLGRNHEDDLDDLIWLFQNFKTIPYLSKAIQEWEQADNLIAELSSVGNTVNRYINQSNLNQTDRKEILKRIILISDKLTINERDFSNTLGDGTREIKKILIITNVFFILLIVVSVSYYYYLMVKKLIISKNEIEDKNGDLEEANKELDRFVYRASHDLRSPITSLMGLVDVLKFEDDLNDIRESLDLMEQSLVKQDQFISELIENTKNKRQKIEIEALSLKNIFDDAMDQLKHIEKVKKITITKDLLIDTIYSDNFRLKIIVNNLLSNAIKYADESKEEMFISIKAYSVEGFYKIEITDNGVGIKKEYIDRIFEMFFVTSNNQGTGLGLYIVKEAVEKLNGNLKVFSEINIGSSFVLVLPNLDRV